MRTIAALLTALAIAGPGIAWGQHAFYEKRYKDPVLEELKELNKKARKKAEEETEKIKKEWKEKREKEKEERKILRFDMSEIPRPKGPEAFKSVWHFPPTPQYYTGTCWAFSTTSFMESEIKRLTGKEIKLSEMWTVYWEYVEKVKGFVESRGNTEFGEGSEANAVTRIWKKYGVVPRSEYEGVVGEDKRFNHGLMFEELKKLLSFCKEQDFWQEETVVAAARSILDRYMGAPPEEVVWEGNTYTPQRFLREVCKIDPEAYVDLMSTLAYPFYTRGEFKVPDNWWHDSSYVNVPLDVWYSVIRKALEAGYSVCIGGDVSEPGIWGFEDIAVVPPFDIPWKLIDQDAREYRIYNGSTTDDHGIHVVGWTRLGEHDWFLIKDSGRSSRWGKYKGYYMFRDDFIKLKMLTIMVHRDIVEDILAKVEANKKEQEGSGD